MKILYFITKSNWGGAQRYVYDLATTMHDRGDQVSVAAGGNGPLFDRLHDHGITTHTLHASQRDISLGKEFRLFGEVNRLIKRERPDVIHVNSSKLGGVGALTGRLLGVRVVFTAHGWPFKEPRFFLARWGIWFFSWVTALLSHAIIVPSQDDLKHGQRMLFCTKKMKLIYHGRQIKNPYEKDKAIIELQQFTKIPTKKPWVGVNAELHPNKGHEYLLRAFQDIDAYLVLMGDGELRTDLAAQAIELGIDDKVFFLGFVPDGARYMRAFDIFVLPSVKEGLPYVLLEGAQLSLPVVASDVAGIAEILGDAGALVAPRDVHGLEQSICQLLGDKKTRHTMGIELRKRFEKMFAFDVMIDETRETYSARVTTI